MLNHVILISFLLLGFFYWFNTQKIKEIALNATRAHCLKMQVQMLDDYIAASHLWYAINKFGKIQLRYTFVFEFSSTGNDRYNGHIIMLGRQVESIYMEPYRIVLD
jgi:hypothetical protein